MVFLKSPAVIYTPVIGLITKPIPTFTRLHDNYGDLVATQLFGHKTLFVRGPSYVEEVFSLEAKNLISRDFMYEARKPLFKDGLINSHLYIWKNQHRIMQPVFTKDSVTTWQTIINEAAEISVNRIRELCGTKVNLTTEIKKSVHSIALQILFGKPMSSSTDSELIQSIDTITSGIAKLLTAEVFGKGQLRWMLALQRKKYDRALYKFTEFVQHEIDHKKTKD